MTQQPKTAPRAQYDAVAPGASKKRRQPRIERAHETGKDSRQLPPMQRLQMIALTRDATRNFSASRAMLRQLGLNVIGNEFKLRIKATGDDAAVRAGQDWFNKTWARQADFRGDLHLCDLNRLIIYSVARDGDVGMLFDRDFAQTGRLVFWESDQICDPKTLPAGVENSSDGVLFDSFGREVGYFCHNGYGQTELELFKGHVFKRDPLNDDENMFRLLRTPWRFNQARGTADFFTVVSDLQDVYEMRASELQTGKVAATLAGYVKKKDPSGHSSATDLRLDPAIPLDDLNEEESAPMPDDEPNYERMEATFGGRFEYLAEDDELGMLDPNRPNLNGAEFAQQVIKSAGSALGLARCYSTMEAQTSYTAYRGEMIMTWVTFASWQKWLERYVRDWQAVRALRFAQDNKLIPQLPDGWEFTLAWQHPKMPSVNPLLDQQTFLAALKNGATSLESETGPGWAELLEQTAEEIKEFQKLGIPHPLFQTASGAIIEEK